MIKQSEREKQSGIDQKASRTAMWTNFCRAMACKEKHPKFRGQDDIAKIFISPVKNFLLSLDFMRAYIRKKLTPGVYEYLMARTKHFDDLFMYALGENVLQIILLGAGYDSRSIRFKDIIQQARIFELDAPTTQQHKIDLLQKANIPIPQQLSIVPINFNNESINYALSNAGYDKNKKSLFILEGVTMYLREDAVKDALDFIKNNSGNGSTVAFDYFYKSVIDGKSDYYGATEQHEAVLKIGEPFQFGIEEGKIESFLYENGFYILSHYTPDEFEKKYLYDDNEEIFGKMYRCACNVHAGIKS